MYNIYDTSMITTFIHIFISLSNKNTEFCDDKLVLMLKANSSDLI